jgi:hypothetical protein
MEINYKDIVPWGRSFDEYIKMFSLTLDDLKSEDIRVAEDLPVSMPK